MHAPYWIELPFLIVTLVVVIVYIGAYVFCLFKDREALRSETYSIQKLAIEKGYVGDSTAGLFKAEELVVDTTAAAQGATE